MKFPSFAIFIIAAASEKNWQTNITKRKNSKSKKENYWTTTRKIKKREQILLWEIPTWNHLIEHWSDENDMNKNLAQ